MASKRLESGIDYTLILRYIQKELALCETGAGSFAYKNCEVSLRALSPRRLGSFSLPRTELALCGEEVDIAEFIENFLLRFLSAGG